MDFIDKIEEIAKRIPKQINHIHTEEATKNAFVMPFIGALGYDIFDPLEVVPEFTADVGTKKGEKVDYAIKKDGNVIILIECKWCNGDLNHEHSNQLFRYFSVVEARFGILTNGIVYKFFSDIEEQNKMDSKPFFEFNILEYENDQIEEIKKFAKSTFDLENILTTASELKYTKAIKQKFAEEISNPSDYFVKYFASQVYSGRMTQPVVDQFSNIVKEATSQFIREKINDRLKSALDVEQKVTVESSPEPVNENSKIGENKKNDIETTQDEIDAFNIIKAIVREVIDLKRITMRDTKSYCGILFDDNNRKPVCRLHFNYSQNYLGLLTNKKEEKVPINDLNEIFNYSDRIKATVAEYLDE